MLALLLAVIGLQMIPPRLHEVPGRRGRRAASRAPAAPLEQRLQWLLYLVFALLGVQRPRRGMQRHQRPAVELRRHADHQRHAQRASSAGSRTSAVDYYDRYSVGQLISRVGNDTEAMKDFVRQATQGFLAQILIVVVTGAMLFSISWKLALWTLLPAPLVIIGEHVLLEAGLPALLPRVGRRSG